jgi:hypothetical protein
MYSLEVLQSDWSIGGQHEAILQARIQPWTEWGSFSQGSMFILNGCGLRKYYTIHVYKEIQKGGSM